MTANGSPASAMVVLKAGHILREIKKFSEYLTSAHGFVGRQTDNSTNCNNATLCQVPYLMRYASRDHTA